MTDSSSDPAGQPADALEAPEAPDATEAGTVPIVALAASAGGVQALEAFFDALPADTGMAFVVLMHLSPDHESNLSEILQHHTPLAVQQIEDGMTPAPNGIYVLPPKRALGIDGGQLQLKAGPAPHEQRTVIDAFLRALAADRGEQAIGIVLSGTGTDGTQGLKALKEAGGFTMVQDPDEAEHDGMPRSAIDTGIIDVVAPTGELATDLVPYWTHAVQIARSIDEVWPEAEKEEQEQVVLKILAQVYAGTGHDVSGYKRSTVMRRIARRLAVHQQSELVDYLELLREHPEETHALFQELLISVTGFFRDPEAFAVLEETVVPTLFEGKGATEQVRVWSVGCATGEEAYALAMLLHEQAERMDRPPELQVFATDLSDEALETAREGRYPESVAADLSPERVERYLVPEGAHYRVRPELREMVLFANHNVLSDPPFSKLDLVSCRNLLIYLNRAMQESAFERLHYALRPGGVLFLGASESIGAAGGLFADLDKEHSIYQRRPLSREDRGVPLFPLNKQRPGEGGAGPLPEPEPQEPERVGALHQRLLLDEVASIIVDESYTIVHLTSPAARYLEYQGGAPTHHVLEVAPQALGMSLRSGLYQAFQKGRATAHRWVRTNAKEDAEYVQVRVRPVEGGSAFAQILLTEMDAPQSELDVEGKGDASSSGYVAQLEEELKQTKEQLQATSEEYETTTEEMETSNEELLSMNEELQSKNEEVETSKEKLQSLNEELKTTNQELKSKIEEARRANSDLQNLMEATDIATLFLDRQLQIERFTPRVSELFNIRPADVGRPLSDFSQRFAYDRFIEDAQTVLDDLQPIEKELQTDEDIWLLVRLRPYRTMNDRIDGVVITFVEITDLKETQFEVEQEREYAVNLVETVWEPLLVLDEGLRVQSVNDAFYETFQVAPEETTGRLVYELGNGQWDIPELRKLLEEVLPEAQVITDYDVEHTFDDIGRRIMRLNARRIEHKQLILLAIEDITERKQAEAALRERREQLEQMLNVEGVGVLIFDETDTLTEANDTFLDMHGYSREDIKARRLTWRDLTPPEYVEESERQLDKLKKTGRIGPYEKEYLHKDGTRSWMLFAGARLGDDAIVEYCVDVSERKEAEAALRQSEIRYRALFETIDEGACLFERVPVRPDGLRDYRYLAMNSAMQEMFGIPDLSGQSIRDNFPDEAEAWYDDYDRVLETGEPIRFVRESEPQGMVLEMFVARLEDGSGKRLIAVMQDITERVRAQEALRKREERFRALVAASATVIYRMSPDWSVMHELDGQGFIADTKQSTEAWMDAYIHPDDQPMVEQAIAQAIRTQSMFDLEHRVRRPDGTLSWMHSRAVPLFDDDGALVEWFGAASDITDRVEAKQHLQWERDFIDRVLETVGALVAVIDLDGRIVRFNRECEVVSGYDAEEAEGQTVFELLIPVEEHEGIREAIERHRAGEDQVTHENHWITKEGEKRLIRWSNTVLRDDKGQVQKLIGTGIDITERRQLERRVVNVSDEERRRIGQDLHDMLASQLAGIAMMVRSLAGKVEKEESVTAEDLHRVAELVADSGGQARALSHSLMPLEVQGERLAEGLRHLAERQETMRADIACTFEADGATPPLEGEVASHLYRIASEAVGNALKHADPGAIAIRLAVDDDQLVLTVRDDGTGISGDTDPTNGLGLHMMQYRSELIGAHLTIEPAAEGGTVVQCRLPLRRATQEDEPQAD